MADYILYGGGVTRALGPQMVFEEGNIPYELRELDEFRGDHKTEEYRSLNPAGYIPALVCPDGTVFHEAAAIMVFIAERHQLQNLIPPTDDAMRGLFWCRLFFQTNDIQTAVRCFFKPEQYTTDPAATEGIKRQAHATAMDRWSVMNDYLDTQGPYNLGDSFSLADLHMALWAAYGLDTPYTVLDAFPAVKRCFELTANRPKVRPHISALQSAMANW